MTLNSGEWKFAIEVMNSHGKRYVPRQFIWGYCGEFGPKGTPFKIVRLFESVGAALAQIEDHPPRGRKGLARKTKIVRVFIGDGGGDDMRERPILFNGEMVRAILAKRKTQTRRPVRGIDHSRPILFADNKIRQLVSVSFIDASKGKFVRSPFGAPGDRLWLRETWDYSYRWTSNAHRLPGRRDIGSIAYRSDGDFRRCYERLRSEIEDLSSEGCPPEPWGLQEAGSGACFTPKKWRPSIHMPRWASRITLEVKRSWVERLGDISEADCEAEGCMHLPNCLGAPYEPRPEYQPTYCGCEGYSPHEIYAVWWDELYVKTKHVRKANPRVWACEFEIVEVKK